MAEQLIRNEQVAGSIPVTSSKIRQSSDCLIFIHCESNGISSAVRLYIITEGV